MLKASHNELENVTVEFLKNIKSVKRFLSHINVMNDDSLREKVKKYEDEEKISISLAFQLAEEMLKNFSEDPNSFTTNFLDEFNSKDNQDEEVDELIEKIRETQLSGERTVDDNLEFANSLLNTISKDLPITIVITETDKKFKLDFERKESVPNLWKVFDESTKELKFINDRYEDQLNLIKSSLIMTANNVEYLIQNLITIVVTNKSHILNNKDNKKWAQINYIELKDFNSISEVQSYIIKNFVDNFMKQKKYYEWLEFVKDTLAVTNRKETWISREDKKTYEDFYDLRNLIMHNNDLLNERDSDETKDTSLGNTKFTIDEITIIMLKMIYYIHLALFEDDEYLRTKMFNSISYNFLQDKEYKMANRLYGFFVNSEKSFLNNDTEITEEFRYVKNIAKMNYIQTFKWLEQPEKMYELLEEGKFDNAPLEFRYSKYLLLDEYDLVSECLNSIVKQQTGKGKTATIEEVIYTYITWPIAKEYRESEEFIEFLKENEIELENVVPIEV